MDRLGEESTTGGRAATIGGGSMMARSAGRRVCNWRNGRYDWWWQHDGEIMDRLGEESATGGRAATIGGSMMARSWTGRWQ
jgi:hypothetical protein